MQQKTHTFLKLLFLLINGAILPIATLYLTMTKSFLLWGEFMIWGLFLIAPFWLILFLGMGVYLFPLDLKTATRLSVVPILQFLVFAFLTGSNWMYSVYVVFYTSFTSVALFLLYYFLKEFFASTGKKTRVAYLIGTAVTIFIGAFIYSLSGPFVREIVGWNSAVNFGIAMVMIVAQVVSIFAGCGQSIAASVRLTEAERKVRDQSWQEFISIEAAVLMISLISSILLVIFTAK